MIAQLHARVLTRGLRCLWWLLVVFAGMAGPVLAAPIELSTARAVLQVGGQTTTQTVTLPYAWDRHHKGQGGSVAFDLAFDLPRLPQEPWAIYFPRVGTAYEVWINGHLIERKGDIHLSLIHI